MTNYERYMDEINNFKNLENFCKDFVMPHILKTSDCCKDGIHCGACHLRQTVWLFEEYEEPAVDWNQVAVDTPILVKEYKGGEWYKSHFAKYKNGVVYAWNNGCTSWSAEGAALPWKYAKLPEEEESNE